MFVSLRDGDKENVVGAMRDLAALGFRILATRGTAARLQQAGVRCEEVHKISQGRPHILDKIHDGEVQCILNTSAGTRTTEDSYTIRRAALDYHIPYTTTISGGLAMTRALESLRHIPLGVKTIQEFAKAID